MKLRLLTTVMIGLLLVLHAGCARGAQYPRKAVNMIVPFPAGGAMDQTARALVEASKNHFKQTIAIQNRAGAAGTLGATEVIQAQADGYTIGMSAAAVMAVQPHLTDVPYKLPPDDYLAVIKVVNLPVLLAVRQEAPWRTMQDVMNHARANPGQIRVAGPGIGTILHIDLELLKEQSGANFTFVPMAGGAETVPALLGGHVEAVVAHPSEVIGHVQAGSVRPLAVFQAQRNPLFAEAPTFKELGYDITHGVYYFIIVPKGTPGDVVQILHDAFKTAIDQESFKTFGIEKGYDVEYLGSEALTEQIRKDYAFYEQTIQKLNLKPR
jgi:tripartite-type tricarboxylate transporter receptor subunit TctC